MASEISLKVFNPSPYSDLSKELGSENLFTFCNDYYDLIMTDQEVTPELLSLVKIKLGINGEITTNTDDESLVNYLLFDCMCTMSHPQVSQIILENHGIEIKPVQYKSGWEFHTFVCVSRKDQSIILKTLSERYSFEIIRIEPDSYGLMTKIGLSSSDIIDTLTESQISLLIEAFKNGYYEIPRRIKLNEIADKYGLSRHAIEKRLRRGENSIMEIVLPLIDFHPLSNDPKNKV